MAEDALASVNEQLLARGYRLRVRKRLLRRPIVILEQHETLHHTRDLNGSGYYDDWTTERWRPANPNKVLADLGIAFAV